MKKLITKTITAEQSFCDHCGKEVIYSEQVCIVCGKVACHECSHERLVRLELTEFPKFWPPLQSLPTFLAYACTKCSNKITRRFDWLKAKTQKRSAACEEWYKWYVEQIACLNQWRDKAVHKHGLDL